MKISNLFFSKDIDQLLATLGIIFAVILTLYLSLSFNRLIYVLPGILSILAFSLWLIIRNKASISLNDKNNPFYFKLLQIVFFIVFFLSIISLYTREHLYERPLLYFVFTSVMVGVLAIQIMLMDENSYTALIFFQVILIGVSLSWSQQLISSSLLGIDPWYHQDVTYNIVNTNHIPEGSYSKLPMFHLLITSILILTEFDYKFASMLSISLLQIICNVLFLFLIARYIYSKNIKICFLATLLLIISNYHIFMSYWLIPNGFAMIFFLPILFVMIKLRKSRPVISTLISIFFAITLTLTHTITAMFTAITLFVYWIGSNIYPFIYPNNSNNKYPYAEIISISYCTLFLVMMVSWWSFASGHIVALSKLIKWGFSIDYFVNTPHEILTESIYNIPQSEQLFNNIGMFIFFSLSFIGLFFMISNKYVSHISFNFALIGIMPLSLGYLFYITGNSIIEQRWWYFAQIMLSIPVALSLFLISQSLKRFNIEHIFMFLGISFISFLLIMSPPANADNHAFSENSTTSYALTTSELKAIETSSRIWDGLIKTDTYYSGTQSYNHNTESFDEELFYYTDITLLSNDLVLLRNNIENKPFMVFQSLVNPQIELIPIFETAHYSNIYSSGSVEGYLHLPIISSRKM